MSPQTGLINSRLFSILGDIIEAHGKPFSSVLDLPFENDGIDASDVAHPRFVACLLRLGDLLDLDDGRHCPTQLKAIGKLPTLSFAHFEKHRSIVSKNINEYSIEIKALCTNYDSFEVQNDWFFYIETEIENQDKYWGEVSPTGYFRKPPSIKQLTCELEGSISLGRKETRLTLDANRVYDFLNGKYIYENQLACILEILQNAVDASIDRLWLESQDSHITMNKFKGDARRFPIEVKVYPRIIDPDKVQYQIQITDQGKGMSLDDISSILTVGSESTQRGKELVRLGMPTWMRPSGFFGIGLQSVFSLTDKLEINTRSAGDSCYEITIRATPGKTPSFVIKRKESRAWKFGTTVSFSILDDAIPSRIFGHNAVFKSLSNFDPLKDSVLNAKEAQIEEQVSEFAKYCEFQISFNGDSLNNPRSCYQIEDLSNGVEYSIEFFLEASMNEWTYRGRPFKNNSRFKYFNIRGNIISERADSFLPLNRENLHHEGQKLLDDKIVKSIRENKKKILESVSNRRVADLYYFLVGIDSGPSWQDIELSGHKINSLIEVGSRIAVNFDLHTGESIVIQQFPLAA